MTADTINDNPDAGDRPIDVDNYRRLVQKFIGLVRLLLCANRIKF